LIAGIDKRKGGFYNLPFFVSGFRCHKGKEKNKVIKQFACLSRRKPLAGLTKAVDKHIDSG